MAVKTFRPFVNGLRLIDGSKLNNLFQGNEQMQAINVLHATLGSQSASPLVDQIIPLSVNNATNTDLTATLPTGALVRSMTAYTTTAFTAVTDAQISVGNAAAGAQYVTAVSIKALGIVSLTLLAAQAAALASFPSGSPNLFIRIAQSGGNTAVGSGLLVVSYVLP